MMAELSDTSTSTILVVDDDPDIGITLTDLLEGEGHKVQVVGTGGDALEKIHQQHFDAVILDIGLPDTDGLTVLREMVELNSQLSVIILTAYTSLEKSVGPLELQGAFGYFTKPFNRDKLKATIRKAVRVSSLASRAERVQKALSGSEIRFQSVVQSCPDAIILADSKGRITEWNNAAERYFGYTEQETVGKPFTMLMPPHYREAHQQRLEEMVLTCETKVIGKTLELEGLRKDGSIFPLELSLGTWTTGNETLLCGIIRDLTIRKRVVQESQKASQQWETALSNLPIPVFLFNQEGQITFASTLAAQHFKAEDQTLMEKPIYEVLPFTADQWNHLVAGFRTAANSGMAQPKEGKCQVHECVYRYRLFSVGEGTDTESNTGIALWEITEFQKMEEQLINMEKLSTLGTMCSGMAHEISNPMQAIVGLSEFLSEETDPSTMKELAGELHRIGKHVTSVLGDFMAYARSTKASEMEVDLSERLNVAVKMVQRGPYFGKVEVVRQFQPLPPLLARPSEMDQVFINLISNAVQAMEGNGTITLSTQVEGSERIIQIGDTGAGIPPAKIHHIFDPFFTTKEEKKGTGLGLAIVQKIVNLYGGTIEVQSQEGEGTTFTLRFPI
jgi:PAS domain S-box-containing protein